MIIREFQLQWNNMAVVSDGGKQFYQIALVRKLNGMLCGEDGVCKSATRVNYSCVMEVKHANAVAVQ